MESYGIWGLVPPLLTIILALVTKDVVVSLFLGILAGSLIVAGGNPAIALLNLTDLFATQLSDGWNIRIFLFCALLGGLVGMLSRTGSAKAFGLWASGHLHSARSSLLLAWFCGIIIFIDDYFNSLAVGTVMRPIADKNKVARAKLAWVLDSTAAPVCIIVPISSWVITVMSLLKGCEGFSSLGIGEFEFFIHAIPFNLYAILTIIMVLVLILTGRDYGPMKTSAKLANEGSLFNPAYGDAPGEVEIVNSGSAEHARVIDMLLPLFVLIVSSLIMFPLTTYLDYEGTIGEAREAMTLAAAFNNTDASKALWYAAIITVLFTYIYYIARGLFSVKQASDALTGGIKSMVPALMILVMAWSIGDIIAAAPADGGVGLAAYLSNVVINGGFPIILLPIIVFILSALISFATGSSWGTFAIMLPIVFPIAAGLARGMGLEGIALLDTISLSVGAVLGGAVFGDHASPISDTTILSSTGAGCPHLEHVATQLPYAASVAFCSLAGYLVGGLTFSLAAAWLTALAIFVLILVFAPHIGRS